MNASARWTTGKDTAPPRVLTYIHRKSGIRATQLRPDIINQEILPDILLLQISSYSGQSALIINIYNAPIGGIRAGDAARALTCLPESYISLPTLLAGDFNLLHSRWQPSLQRPPTNFAATFLEWLDRLGLLLTSEVDIPTHDKATSWTLPLSQAPQTSLEPVLKLYNILMLPLIIAHFLHSSLGGSSI